MAPEMSYNRPNGDVCMPAVPYRTQGPFPINPSQGYKTGKEDSTTIYTVIALEKEMHVLYLSDIPEDKTMPF